MQIEDARVLVTGADGFIGSHLVERLVQLGAKVRAFVFYNSFNSWGWLDHVPDEVRGRIEVVPGDIRDPHAVRQAMDGCGAVLHLAALIGIPFSYTSPDSYVDTNVKGTLNILQAAREHGARRVLVTSTSEVYGTAKYVPIDEGHPLQAQSPYSATKIAADRLSESFHKSFSLPVTIVRPFNTYGPRQSARAIIPTILQQLATSEGTVRLGNLSPTRDFVFVQDTVEGFVRILERDSCVGEEINIATGVETSMEILARRLIQAMNPQAKLVSDEERRRPEASEVERLLGDNTKLQRMTGWSPRVSLSEGLGKTIDWWRAQGELDALKVRLYAR